MNRQRLSKSLGISALLVLACSGSKLGPQGEPGQSVTTTALAPGNAVCKHGGVIIHSVSGDTYLCSSDSALTTLKGEKGDKGDKGDPGSPGSFTGTFQGNSAIQGRMDVTGDLSVEGKLSIGLVYRGNKEPETEPNCQPVWKDRDRTLYWYTDCYCKVGEQAISGGAYAKPGTSIHESRAMVHDKIAFVWRTACSNNADGALVECDHLSYFCARVWP